MQKAIIAWVALTAMIAGHGEHNVKWAYVACMKGGEHDAEQRLGCDVLNGVLLRETKRKLYLVLLLQEALQMGGKVRQELKTERLQLRPLGMGDLDTVHVYASDVENTRYMLHLPNDTREQSAAFLYSVEQEWEKEQPEFYEFAVLYNGVQIGAVSCCLNEARTEGELGWILDKRYWGNGYATEAAAAVKAFVEEELGIKRFVAHCDQRNQASAAVMRKLGLRYARDNGTRVYPKTGECAGELRCSTEPD